MIDKSESTVASWVEGEICRIDLCDEKRRNPLSTQTMEALSAALDNASKDVATRVIILGHKGSVFSAGHDLKEVSQARNDDDRGKEFYQKLMAQCSALMQKIVNCPKPVIAQVDGTATAAGCQLVASCDLAYASTVSRFATPGVHIGLFCSTPMVALSRNVGRKHAMEMLLTGDFTNAEKAVEIGLINEMITPEELSSYVDTIAAKIVSKSSATVKIGKQAFYKQIEMPLEKAYEYASEVMVDNLSFKDSEEGINAFIEKRDPNWQDK